MSNNYLDNIYLKKYLGVNIANDWEDYKASLGVKRNKNAIKIIVYPGVFNVAYYRIFTPLMELLKNPNYDVRIMTIIYRNDIDWADIVYYQRYAENTAIPEAKRAKKQGKKIIYDTDDYMHGLPFYHPQKRTIENSRHLMDMDELCGIADLVTVSTEYLKGLYSARYQTPIVVLPNCVRVEDCDSSYRHKFKDKTYLGWAGSATHFEDLKLLTPVLKTLVSEFKDLFILMMNYSGIDQQPYRDALEGVPLDRRLLIGGTQPHLVYNGMSIMDIGLAPLLDNKFNHSKSNVKVLEYGMCEVPAVVSNSAAYRGDEGWVSLIEDNSQDEWYKCLKSLIVDKVMRRETGTLLKKYITEKYDIGNNVKLWESAFKNTLNGW